MAVEMMFSMSYLYRFYGISNFADKAERPAFNALPAALSPNCESDCTIKPYKTLGISPD